MAKDHIASRDHAHADGSVTSGHTPGPWGYPVWNAGEACVSVSLTGFPYDCWRSPGGSAYRERDMANGHLIAAAPELLEALKGLASEVFGSGPDSEPDVYADYDRLNELSRQTKDAIAKATGEQP